MQEASHLPFAWTDMSREGFHITLRQRTQPTPPLPEGARESVCDFFDGWLARNQSTSKGAQDRRDWQDYWHD